MTDCVRVLVFGTTPPCARCRQAEEQARRAAEKFPAGQVLVEKHDALSELGQKYGIMMTPTVLINDKKVSVGKVLNESELAEIIEKELGGQ
ncbi:MAG: thioredoxin family protein [Bacillota bacterium]